MWRLSYLYIMTTSGKFLFDTNHQKFKRIHWNLNKNWNLECFKEETMREPLWVKTVSWDRVLKGLMEAANEVLGKLKIKSRKTWTTEQILGWINEKNKLSKLNNMGRYRRIKDYITKICRERKEQWMKEITEEIKEDTKKRKTGETYYKPELFIQTKNKVCNS